MHVKTVNWRAQSQGSFWGGWGEEKNYRLHSWLRWDIKEMYISDRNHLEQSQERMASRLKAPPPMLRSVRWVPAYDVVSGDTYLKNNKTKVSNKEHLHIDKTVKERKLNTSISDLKDFSKRWSEQQQRDIFMNVLNSVMLYPAWQWMTRTWGSPAAGRRTSWPCSSALALSSGCCRVPGFGSVKTPTPAAGPPTDLAHTPYWSAERDRERRSDYTGVYS